MKRVTIQEPVNQLVLHTGDVDRLIRILDAFVSMPDGRLHPEANNARLFRNLIKTHWEEGK
jgi:hypothetical protein